MCSNQVPYSSSSKCTDYHVPYFSIHSCNKFFYGWCLLIYLSCKWGWQSLVTACQILAPIYWTKMARSTSNKAQKNIDLSWFQHGKFILTFLAPPTSTQPLIFEGPNFPVDEWRKHSSTGHVSGQPRDCTPLSFSLYYVLPPFHNCYAVTQREYIILHTVWGVYCMKKTFFWQVLWVVSPEIVNSYSRSLRCFLETKMLQPKLCFSCVLLIHL
jgi:hypothetical protein